MPESELRELGLGYRAKFIRYTGHATQTVRPDSGKVWGRFGDGLGTVWGRFEGCAALGEARIFRADPFISK